MLKRKLTKKKAVNASAKATKAHEIKDVLKVLKVPIPDVMKGLEAPGNQN